MSAGMTIPSRKYKYSLYWGWKRTIKDAVYDPNIMRVSNATYSNFLRLIGYIGFIQLFFSVNCKLFYSGDCLQFCKHFKSYIEYLPQSYCNKFRKVIFIWKFIQRVLSLTHHQFFITTDVHEQKYNTCCSSPFIYNFINSSIILSRV